ncbi:CAF1 family ribonuclease [Aspergillus brunneoviolaceus CBS 621.78]|uniref:CAF1 family ribonuclease n=1 Tax=Aspergillus brunneoviolaceus CBS 621.78 TaxID=1450534 RepID=A0ACD1GLC4_9EURO|nr:CAF1 family ribonuclease [Aspergillus brunneoviolaceus CBS 621.78]RAH49938.1 CAF1 family ribonuclease [Aspergillus brunneoviolaceus CBS 621.78]
MDITAQNFGLTLPMLLDELSTCCFVALDFEFSGIAKSLDGGTSRRSTLQERYEEVKTSADHFQILQVGLTICHEDPKEGIYTLRPYNLYLSPIIDDRLGIERHWSFQSSAVSFLLTHRFSMDSLFRNGVGYLSRDEEIKATARVTERFKRPEATTTIGVDETESESIAFLQEVRRLVDEWLALGTARGNYLNIPPASRPGAVEKPGLMPVELNRFQKRLIYQLIEVEYPLLKAFGRPAGFLQIIDRDEKREQAVLAQKIESTQKRAWEQTGFRWVAEALAGGDLTNLPQDYFSNRWAGLQGPRPQLNSDQIKQRLRATRPVLVGHNLFTDLIYFCRCFFGPLPDRVEEFQSMTHEMFPVLMDTKYMATHDCGSINPTSSLQDIHNKLAPNLYPKTKLASRHTKYEAQGINHEAGYDSLLTAEVFIKLSAQLRDRGADDEPTPPAQELIWQGLTPKSGRPASAESHEQLVEHTSNNYMNLRTGEAEEASKSAALSVSAESPGASGMALRPSNSIAIQDRANRGRLIPRLDAKFWSTYGNKLRVFGTQERVCHFGPSASDSRVCRSCQETIVRRQYASAATTQGTPETTTAPPSSAFPVVKPTHTIKAGVLLSRQPQITRDLTDFEKAYFFYQRRLNERLTLPFTKYFYFKRGTPADEDWKRKIRERQTAARDIGKYNAYSKDAWNDELLVGAVESDPAHQVEMLVQDAEATANATSQDTSKKEEIPRPFPRWTEADEKGDDKSLNRALQRTLYLLVQSKEGYWKLPSSAVEPEETMKQAAQRTLAQAAGVNMNTWFVGYHPVGHYVYNLRKPSSELRGEKTFFMKARIFTGQADLTGNADNLTDFKWLAKDEIAKYVRPQYYASIKNMLAER